MEYLDAGSLASDHPDNRALQVLMVRSPAMPGNSSRLCDFGPRRRHATLANAPIWEGAPGGQLALKLNGTTQSGTSTNPSGAAGLTVALWWKSTSASGNVVAIGWSNQIWIGLTGGKAVFYPGGSGQAQEGTASSNDGNWHRIVAIHLAGTSKIFVDGVERASAAGTLHTTPITTMGIGVFGGGFFFPGSLAGIRVHAVGFQSDWAARDWRYSQRLDADPRLATAKRSSRRTVPSLDVQFDAKANSGYQAASSGYSFSRTVAANSDRYLEIPVAILSAGGSVTSIVDDFGGTAVNAVLVGFETSVTGTGRVELWRVIAPAAGTKTIQVNLSGSIASAAGAISYYNVHQTSPTEGWNSASQTNVGAADATVTVTSTTDKCLFVAAVATMDMTVIGNQTERNNVSGAGGSLVDEDFGPKTPAGSEAMSFGNVGAGMTWVVGGHAIRPASAGGLGGLSMAVAMAHYRRMRS